MAQGSSIFSSTSAAAASASATLQVPSNVTHVRVTAGNGVAANFFVLPTAEQGSLSGQMLVIHNQDDQILQDKTMQVNDISPGYAVTYLYLGERWIETAMHCTAKDGAC